MKACLIWQNTPDKRLKNHQAWWFFSLKHASLSLFVGAFFLLFQPVAIFANPLSEPSQVLAPTSEHSGLASSESQPQPVDVPPSSLTIDQQIRLIDLEILLLKAELAQRNAQPSQARVFVSTFKQSSHDIPLSSDLEDRLKALEQYLADSTEVPLTPITFQFDPSKMLALLPMTGPYADAGLDVLEGLQSEMDKHYPEREIQVLDTHVYDSMFDIWEWVRLYQPSFVFGPLQKQNVEGLNELNLQLPALVFNPLPQPMDSVKVLSPALEQDSINRLIQMIEEGGYQRVLFLTDESDKSKQLWQRFQSSWLPQETVVEEGKIPQVDIEVENKPLPKPPNPNPTTESLDTSELTISVFSSEEEEQAALRAETEILHTVVTSNVDQAMADALNTVSSKGRANWLQKIVESPVLSRERPRQDLELVVSFLPHHFAMQVSPLLEYYHLSRVSHVWVPSQLPSSTQFLSSLPFWQATNAILPTYYARGIQQKRRKTDDESKTGTFYALGQVAAKAVTEMTPENPSVMSPLLGRLTRDEKGNYHFIPHLYWIDTGAFEVLRP